MSALSQTDRLFFTQAGLDPARVTRIVGEALAGTDDGAAVAAKGDSNKVAKANGSATR